MTKREVIAKRFMIPNASTASVATATAFGRREPWFLAYRLHCPERAFNHRDTKDKEKTYSAYLCPFYFVLSYVSTMNP